MKFLQGKRTYIIAALLFVLGGLHALGVVDDQIYKDGIAFLLPAGLATLRASMPQ